MTHEVLNQVPPLEGTLVDPLLREAVRREGAEWALPRVEELGELLGRPEVRELGFRANEYPPTLRTHDATGHRIDEVDFHPAWHALMRISVEHGVHNLPWAEPRAGAHVARAALSYLIAENETGHLCPISMTYSCVPALRKEPSVAAEWEKRLTNDYDPRFLPADRKRGILVGMAMTEKQGGSDVRANTTRAVPADGGYLITGHKWFCSAPMCDAFLVLAQAPGGLTCFLLPRWTPDGRRNRMFLQRLKTKLGNRSNASSEVEFDGAWAGRVGEEGRGVPTIIEMVAHTRLDCVIASSANMRQAYAHALHHARHRSAFGKKLVDQPLMRNVLADLAIESEAATLLMMRLARAFDRREEEEPFRRLAMPVAKYWVCKRAPIVVGEALECLGGNGYVEESILPRLYREVPLYSIWEGAGNVNCLDVLRAISKDPRCVDAFLAELGDRRLTAFVEPALARPSEADARRLTQRLAVALQASLLLRHSSTAVSDAFLASRLTEGFGAFGTLNGDFAKILG